MCKRKEAGEVSSVGKLTKRGITMTCSICKFNTHNKRGCPSRPQTTTRVPTRNRKVAATSAPSRRKYSQPPTRALAASNKTPITAVVAPTITTTTAHMTTTSALSRRKYTKPPVPPRPKATTKVNASQKSSTDSTKKVVFWHSKKYLQAWEGGRSKYKTSRVVG